jgi:hypothetical protein
MRIQIFLFCLGIVSLSIGTVIWGFAFFHTLKEYEKYDELVRDQELGLPLPYHAWDGGKYVNIALIILFFLWIPFLDYSLRKKTYPFLRQKLTYRKFKSFWRSVARSLYEDLYGLVLGYFTRVNRRVRTKIAFWFMKVETFEHVHLLTKVFKWVVLPSSILYVCAIFYFFELNALDSMFVGIMLFFYSNFLPDLPAIFRRKVYRDVRDIFYENLPWYKKYALLLFAPFFIALVFCEVEIKWRTTETFHNFKSLAVYGVFLFVLSFLFLAVFPISFGGVIEVLCVPVYALLGYLTHLKVDLVF